jgi:IPT/TIG domain
MRSIHRHSATRATRSQVRLHLQLEQLEDRTVPTLLGQQLFPSENPWNQPITSAPLAANSTAIMNNIISHYGDGRLHPDFGQDYHAAQDLYGIPYNIVHGNTAAFLPVVIDAYSDESDLQTAPIPINAVLEGDYQNGPRPGLDNRGDSHLLVWDADHNVAYEFYRASRPNENADGKWHADQETVWDMKTNQFRTLGWTSADAAGLSILAGLVRPDEALPVSQGGEGVIRHPIRFTLQNSIILNQFLYPASHTANPGNTNAAIQPPMGARFRLKSTVDLSQLNPQSRIIAQAMKDYGLIVADNGSNFFFQGASSAVDGNNQLTLTWNDNDVQDTLHGLKSLHFSDFEVVDLTPRVTALDVHSGAAGTVVTVIGQNFNGSAGHLQVLFGTTAATSVTYLDDAHLRATAPAGSGTVDVRIVSGVSANNASNYTGTIFGYGVSATSAADLFTYGTPPANAAPTIAQAASVSPSPVKGKTATLNVLGADDGGEANLIYSWSVVSKPAGAANPTYSINGSNAAKTTQVRFYKSGVYMFRATITDVQGLSATSDVTVTVLRSPKSIAVTATATTLRVNQSRKFHATLLDQFDDPMPEQPIFKWRLYGLGYLGPRGRYFAPGTPGGPYVVAASAAGLKGAVKIRVLA